LNEQHSTRVTPNWYGHSIGHFEGNTLVVDTVGFKTGPLSMVDEFVTPHSGAPKPRAVWLSTGVSRAKSL
jgi:hypothetical protein